MVNVIVLALPDAAAVADDAAFNDMCESLREDLLFPSARLSLDALTLVDIVQLDQC